MKFVGSIKGKNFLIDPETYEAELREKIAKEVDALRLPTRNLQFNAAILDAVKIIRGEN